MSTDEPGIPVRLPDRDPTLRIEIEMPEARAAEVRAGVETDATWSPSQEEAAIEADLEVRCERRLVDLAYNVVAHGGAAAGRRLAADIDALEQRWRDAVARAKQSAAGSGKIDPP